mmetsp:Transcript_44929/g.66092  ORF Transcript_44929/g.66092 Transcript_44929/m.66092 type:complete len:334 (-) Transcript_44929:190-1191(-)|eukprot:CAMPEP_0195529236 /NCGR_PEP_ID=MMETSP0794_2-20130614/31697_1 /TAXON_ID=515487 /ORGANISM="Stephanopyxis turris, Strain CCMP 815" /LENGTH=333 /DNA_ID=CAMNT_0040660509 /DNA_START=107 /DNA_END=1108 /DNA_ORIENTATION=+
MQYSELEDDSHRLIVDNDNGNPASSGNSSPTGTPNGSVISSASKLFQKRKKKSKKSSKDASSGDLSEPLTLSSSSGDVEMGNGIANGGDDEEDPFHVFREDLMRKLTLADEGLASYLKVVRETDTAVNTHDLKDSKKQLKRHIKHAESTLKDLRMTVKSVESRRDQFLHIDDDELHSRSVFINDSQDRLSRIKAKLGSSEIRHKIMQDEKALAARRFGNRGTETKLEKENTAFMVDKHAEAQVMLQEQDDTLDELDNAVERVGQMAGEINAEIGQQNIMLGEFEDDLNDAEEKLGLVMGKLGKLLKTKSKWQLGTILGLSLVVIVLFFLVIYT